MREAVGLCRAAIVSDSTVDALYGARDYIDRCKADYMVICNADVISNIDVMIQSILFFIKN